MKKIFDASIEIKKKNTLGAFTLVEIIITITILALIFTSVMSVFIYYTTLGARVETNRLLQSNIKNITEHIDQDIRNNGLKISIADSLGNCSVSSSHCMTGAKAFIDTDIQSYNASVDQLYTNQSSYYLAKETTSNGWIKIDEAQYASECAPVSKDHNCRLVKLVGGNIIPLSNSWVSLNNLYFHVSNDKVAKVTMNFDMSIIAGRGIKDSLVESSSIKIQTTMSEKLLDKNK